MGKTDKTCLKSEGNLRDTKKNNEWGYERIRKYGERMTAGKQRLTFFVSAKGGPTMCGGEEIVHDTSIPN